MPRKKVFEMQTRDLTRSDWITGIRPSKNIESAWPLTWGQKKKTKVILYDSEEKKAGMFRIEAKQQMRCINRELTFVRKLRKAYINV